MKRLAILGCTGSIGDTAFRVLERLRDEYQVVGLSGGQRTDKLVERARAWHPRRVAVSRPDQAEQVTQDLPGVEVLCGEEGLIALAAQDGVDVVLNALVGAVGL